jgi:hypothetical protein
MAIQAYVSLSEAAGYVKRPIDNHGKHRSLYKKFVCAVQGDINSTFDLGFLPPGAVRLIYPFCFIKSSAWGAGALLNIGYATYRFAQDKATLGDGMEPATANGVAANLDCSAAARTPWSAGLIKWDFYSLAGVNLIATVAGAIVPAAATLEVLTSYIYE